MIDEDRTMQLFGYYSYMLLFGSHKPIIIICEKCGKYNKVRFAAYNIRKYPNLCRSCSQKDKIVSEETKQKISKTEKGKKLSDETKAKISKSQKGKIVSDETRRKMSIIKSGSNHPMFGKHHSEESKAKISKATKGENNPFYGKHHSDETRQKISDNIPDQLGKNNPFYGKKHSDESKRKSSCTKQGIDIEDWNGFSKRDYVKSECNCIQLNQRFEGSEMHHIMSCVVIYIPKNIHNRKYGISHNMKTGKGMEEINKLAFNYLMGDI